MPERNNEYVYQPPAKFTEELRQRINNAGFGDEFKQQIKSAQKEEGRKMFERLTHRDSKGDVWIKDAAHVDEQGQICMLSDRLAAYEDSGLSPEEVQELAKAKADGRLVELPCKIGDEVWFLEKQLDIANGTCSTVISEYIVTEIRGNKYNPLWYMASSERCTHRDFHPTELGKTVFLSREEAEKALGGGESD